MTRTRVITALIFLPLLAFLVYYGSWPYLLAVIAAALVGSWEYVRMMKVKGHAPNLFVVMALSLALIADFWVTSINITRPAVTILVMGALAAQLFRSEAEAPVVDWALSLAGAAYIGLGLGHIMGLRLLEPAGQLLVWMALLCTWGNDSFAYFGGRAFGKHKFWPRWSPKKTWEGIFAGGLGGIALALLVAWIAVMLDVPRIAYIHAIVIGLLAAVVGPLGDLSISMIKRYTGVKDSSNLIPGHGGVLDRMDSLVFVFVTVFYYATWFIPGIT